jgi:hypothetical protein
MHSYTPEMGQSADTSKLFAGSHGYKSYTVTWLQSRDDEAKAVFKKLRVHPRNVRAEAQDKYLSPLAKIGDIRVATLTYDAGNKLQDADLMTLELLLD